MKKFSIVAIISSVSLALALTGCGNTSNTNDLFPNDPQNGQSSSSSAYSTQSSTTTTTPSVIVDSTTSEEERTHFDSFWELFDYKKDKSEIAFMSIETDDGVQNMYIPSFEEQLRIYGEKPKVQTDGGLYAFDSTGATIAAVPNSDGSVDYQLCDGGVLQAALENKYTQVLKSGSTCLGMHLGTSTGFLELYVTGIKEVESDIGNAVKYVLERDDYRLTVYANGGNCFWFIVTIFNNSTGSGNDTSSNTDSNLTELPEAPPKDFDYTYNDDLKGLEIIAYLGESSELRFPATINNDPVVGISLGETNLLKLTRIVIPNTVKELSLYHNNLATIEIPEGVTKIDLYSCSAITSINIPSSAEVLSISNCDNLKYIEMPEGVKQINFKDCKRLSEITIPDSVTEIDRYTFSGCTELSRVHIGNGMTKIDSSTFTSNKKLTSITYKDKTYYPSNLDELYDLINLGESGMSIVNGQLREVSVNLTELVIPDEVTSIRVVDGYSPFNNCNKLEQITFGKGIVGFPRETFAKCTSLKSIVLGDGMAEVVGCSYKMGLTMTPSQSQFKNAPNLSSVTIGKNTTTITDSAFAYCQALTEVVIPDSVTVIGNGAFQGCISLEEINLPSHLTEIGVGAFKGCTNLKRIIIPNSVTSIGYMAFSDCTSLESIIIPNGVTKIDSYAFKGCTSLMNVTIPDSVTEIGYDAFDQCPSLASATYKGKTYNYAHIKDLYKAIKGN